VTGCEMAESATLSLEAVALVMGGVVLPWVVMGEWF